MNKSYQNRSGGQFYSVRGGRSGDGYKCGTFYFELSVTISYWGTGAVISYKCQNRSGTRCTPRGGGSSNGYDNGAFYIFLVSVFSADVWWIGAALSYKPVFLLFRLFLSKSK